MTIAEKRGTFFYSFTGSSTMQLNLLLLHVHFTRVIFILLIQLLGNASQGQGSSRRLLLQMQD
jgi:hypothetical protein